MARGKLIGVWIAIIALAFAIGGVMRVDQSGATRRVRHRIAAMRGPHFPQGDTLVMADTLRARCGAMTGKVKVACYTSQLLALQMQRGTRFAMGTLDRLNTIDRDVAYSGHDYTHAIGIAAYKDSRDVSGAFKSCTEILQSGCYHGVIETYLLDVPQVGAAEVNAVCREWTAPDGDRWLRFQCVHGMGHGLEMYRAHELPRALEGCDLLDEEWDRKSCYGGAFMENVVFATDPSMAQMVMRDAPGGHAMEMPATTKFKMIDRADPYYPCSAVGEKYQEDCWLMQPAVMLQIYGGDFDKTFGACDGAPAERRAGCYQGTGTEVVGATTGDHREAVAYCARGSARWRPWCFTGVVKNLIDVTAKPADGIAFCVLVPDRASQLKCYQSVGEEIAVLRSDLDARRPLCEVITGDADARDACLFGAQILDKPPRGTPVAG